MNGEKNSRSKNGNRKAKISYYYNCLVTDKRSRILKRTTTGGGVNEKNLRSYHDFEAMEKRESGKEPIIGIACLPDKRSRILK